VTGLKPRAGWKPTFRSHALEGGVYSAQVFTPASTSSLIRRVISQNFKYLWLDFAFEKLLHRTRCYRAGATLARKKRYAAATALVPGGRWLQPSANEFGEHPTQALFTLLSEMLDHSQEVFI
jgi:hypothetical protein